MDHLESYDLELVRRIASRDRDALADLYRRHGRVLFGQILIEARAKRFSRTRWSPSGTVRRRSVEIRGFARG